MTISFIHTADLHLGCKFTNASFPNSIAKQRKNEMWITLGNIIETAKNKKVDFIFIAGDLFEEDYISLGDLKRISGLFSSIPDISIIITPGNHDPLGHNSPYENISWPFNVHIFQENKISKLEFEDKNTIVYGYSWKDQEDTNFINNQFDEIDISKNNILVIHGDIYDKNSRYLPLNFDESITKTFDYIALGHIHKANEISTNIYYCGCPEPLDFGETGKKGIMYGEILNSEIITEFIPISQREFIIKEININPEMAFEDIVEMIVEKIHERNLYRFILKGIIDADIPIEDLEDYISNYFYHVEIKNKTMPDYNLEKLLQENGKNIIGKYIDKMHKNGMEDPIQRDALYLGLEALLKEKVK